MGTVALPAMASSAIPRSRLASRASSLAACARTLHPALLGPPFLPPPGGTSPAPPGQTPPTAIVAARAPLRACAEKRSKEIPRRLPDWLLSLPMSPSPLSAARSMSRSADGSLAMAFSNFAAVAPCSDAPCSVFSSLGIVVVQRDEGSV